MTWSMAIDLLRGGLFSLAHFCGGSMGLAIVVASIVFRAIMLPFAVRAARRQAAAPAQKAVPDIGAVAQLPLGIALYAAIRGIGERGGAFLWVKSLARPDRVLAIFAAIVAGGLSWLASSTQALTAAPAGSAGRNVALAISVLIAAG